MSPASKRLGPAELRTAFFQFTVNLPAAVSSVFLALWLSKLGIRPEEIGLINSLPVILVVVLNVVVGRIADRASDWRNIIIITVLLDGLAAFGLLFVHDFWGVLVVWSFCIMLNGSVNPVLDAATVRMTKRNGTDFAFVRAWATIGYVVGAGGIGAWIGFLGPAYFVPLYIAMSVVRVVTSVFLPRFRDHGEHKAIAKPPKLTKLRSSLKPWFVLPLVAFALINTGSILMSAFAALVWSQNDIPSYLYGPLLATSAISEATMMVVWRWLNIRIRARLLILISCFGAMARFTLLAFNPPIPLIVVAQMLHSISFGVGYLGLVDFIASWTEESNAAEAQGFATMLQQAASIGAIALFGWLVAHFGSYAFFASTAVSAIAVVLVLISLKLHPAHGRNEHSQQDLDDIATGLESGSSSAEQRI